ncbi:nucleic-acid-binding protein [Rhodotorula toruloides]|uniref:Nucleic-acid-binding protein n=1 Tax=Rhodotorula toruloides TaxID=5286 RepID=A0A511K7H9_RHOTO|nr:nucleic-acid-binding protein [Rhodotorula toruloides]
MNTYLYFFQSLHALRMLPARRMHGTLSGGAASRLPIETWDLLLQVTQLVAKEEFRDEMDDFTFRTLDCYILAEPVVNQFYNNWEPMSLFLQQYHLAADWYRWPQSRESLDYPEEVEAEAEEAGWKFNVPQTEFVHLRYRSSLDEVLRYASATASYGMSTAATKLPEVLNPSTA